MIGRAFRGGARKPGNDCLDPHASRGRPPSHGIPERRSSMQKKTLYILLAVVLVIVIVAGAAFVVLTAPPKKYQLELWYNNDGHYGDTEASLATVLKASIEACGKVQVTLKSDTWAVFKQRRAAGTMPMFLLGWYPDYFDT